MLAQAVEDDEALVRGHAAWAPGRIQNRAGIPGDPGVRGRRGPGGPPTRSSSYDIAQEQFDHVGNTGFFQEVGQGRAAQLPAEPVE